MEKIGQADRQARGGGRLLTARRAELAAGAALAAGAVVLFFAVPTYPGLDSYYHLVWGRELLGGESPSFDGYRAPTHHPLWVLVGGLLSLLGGDGERLMVLVALVSLVALLWGLYRLGSGLFGLWPGLVGAVLAALSFQFALYAVRGFVDVPFLALVVWAGALLVSGSGPASMSGLGAMALLFVAGLLRPEAWLLALLLWLWLGWRRWDLLLLALAAPAVWLVVDLVATGDPLFSVTSTGELAEELRHEGGVAEVGKQYVSFLAVTLRPPVLALAVVGLGLALWRFGMRALAVPVGLIVAGSLTFAVTGLAGLSIIPRYLTVPAAALFVFAGYALLGFMELPGGNRWRRRWMGVSACAAAVGVVVAVVLVPSSVRRVRGEAELVRDSHDELAALLAMPAVRRGMRCGPLTFPSDRLVPDARWLLDVPPERVLARTAPGAGRPGVLVYVTGEKAIDRFGHAAGIPERTNEPPRGAPDARAGRFLAYERCQG